MQRITPTDQVPSEEETSRLLRSLEDYADAAEQEQALTTIVGLLEGGGSDVAEQLVEAGMVQHLVNVIGSCSSFSYNETQVEVLSLRIFLLILNFRALPKHFFTDTDIKISLFPVQLTLLLKSPDKPNARQLAAKIICELTTDNISLTKDFARHYDIIPILSKLLTDDADLTIQQDAVDILINVASVIGSSDKGLQTLKDNLIVGKLADCIDKHVTDDSLTLDVVLAMTKEAISKEAISKSQAAIESEPEPVDAPNTASAEDGGKGIEAHPVAKTPEYPEADKENIVENKDSRTTSEMALTKSTTVLKSGPDPVETAAKETKAIVPTVEESEADPTEETTVEDTKEKSTEETTAVEITPAFVSKADDTVKTDSESSECSSVAGSDIFHDAEDLEIDIGEPEDKSVPCIYPLGACLYIGICLHLLFINHRGWCANFVAHCLCWFVNSVAYCLEWWQLLQDLILG